MPLSAGEGHPGAELDYLLRKLQQDRQSLLKELGNRWMGTVIDATSLWDGRELLYSGVFFLCKEGEQADSAFPAGTYLSLIHAEPYASIRESYRQLYARAEQEGIRVLDMPLELYPTESTTLAWKRSSARSCRCAWRTAKKFRAFQAPRTMVN